MNTYMTDMTLIQDSPREEKTGTPLPTTRNCIVLWYHEADFEILTTLDQYLQLLYRRLGTQIDRSYFGYPKYMPKAPSRPKEPSDFLAKTYEKDLSTYQEELKKYQVKYSNAVRILERAVLFIPCMSNTFLTQFWTDIERDPALRTSLENPDFQVMPVMIRPTEIGISSLSEPLCAYEGYHREVACQQIASMIEAALINSGDYKPVETPLTTLFSSSATLHIAIPSQHNPTIDLLKNALTPVKTLLEQASTQVVEANQLALATQSKHDTLTAQIEAMKQQLTTIQERQNARIFSKIGRRLKPTTKL